MGLYFKGNLSAYVTFVISSMSFTYAEKYITSHNCLSSIELISIQFSENTDYIGLKYFIQGYFCLAVSLYVSLSRYVSLCICYTLYVWVCL